MQSSQTQKYSNTRNALSSLENRLKCTVCKSLAASPVTLGGCEHIFCSVCCEEYLGGSCPECYLPAHVKDAEVDRQLFNMATLCGRLRDILDEVNGKNSNKDDMGNIYCTPSQGLQQIEANTDAHHSFTGVKGKPKPNSGKDITENRRAKPNPGKNKADEQHSDTDGKHKSNLGKDSKENVRSKPNTRKDKENEKADVKQTRRRSSGRGRGNSKVVNEEGDTMVIDDMSNDNIDDDIQKTRVSNRKSDVRTRNPGTGRGISKVVSEEGETIVNDDMSNNNDDADIQKHRVSNRMSDVGTRNNSRGRRLSALVDKGDSIVNDSTSTSNSNDKIVESIQKSDSDQGNSRRSRRSSLPTTKTEPSGAVVSETKLKLSTPSTRVSDKFDQSKDTEHKVNTSAAVNNAKKTKTKTTRQRKSIGATDLASTEITDQVGDDQGQSNKKQENPNTGACDAAREVTPSKDQGASNKKGSKSGPNQKKTTKKKTADKTKAEEESDVNTSILPQTPTIGGKGKRKSTSQNDDTMSPAARKRPLKGEVHTPKLKTTMKEVTSPGLNKRNAKGETLLHVAAIKNDVSRVQQLLESGANPNLRDNAGWTPLHEACNHGYTQVARLLLDHGAMMNVPGFENDSPLHDAVSNGRLDCVKLLVSRGASTTARNLHGLTPLDYAKTQEMKDALQTTVTECVQTSKEVIDVLEYQQPCLLGTGLSREEKSLLQKIGNQLKVKLSEEVTPEVTHIVTKCNSNGMGPRTTKIVQGILSGKWILSIEWLTLCKEMNSLVCEEAFEIPGLSMFPDCKSPYKGRMNRKQQLPGLFDGCWFYFSGDFEFSVPPKADLVATIKLGGGKILTREPKPGHLDDTTLTVPYHADQDSELKDCCMFVVYPTGNKCQPIRTKYICSVPASWVIDCAATFTLLPLPKD